MNAIARQLKKPVTPLGLGTNSMTTDGRPDRETCIAAIDAAYRGGIRFFDTADVYHRFGEAPGYGEELLGEALKRMGPQAASEVVVATKGGLFRKPDGKTGFQLSPSMLRDACLASRERLGVGSIDLYQLHHFDPTKTDSSFPELLTTLQELREEGVIKAVGLSNVSPSELEDAKAVLGDDLVSVQAQYGLDHAQNKPLLEKAEALDIVFMPWAPFGGVVEGKGFPDRFPLFKELGNAHGVSARAAYLSYLLGASPNILPIPGASRAEHVIDWQDAPSVNLSGEEIARIEGAYGSLRTEGASDAREAP